MFKKVIKSIIALALIVSTLAVPVAANETREVRDFEVARSGIWVDWPAYQVDAFNELQAANVAAFENAVVMLEEAFSAVAAAHEALMEQLEQAIAEAEEVAYASDAVAEIQAQIDAVWAEKEEAQEAAGLSAIAEQVDALIAETWAIEVELMELDEDDPAREPLLEELEELQAEIAQLMEESDALYQAVEAELAVFSAAIEALHDEMSELVLELIDAAIADLIVEIIALEDTWGALEALEAQLEELVEQANNILPQIDAGNLSFAEAALLVEASIAAFNALAAEAAELAGLDGSSVPAPDIPGDDGDEDPGDTSDDGDDETPADWCSVLIDLQLDSAETIVYVGEYFLELWSYLLAHHLLNQAAFDAYWELYGEFTDLIDEAVQIGLDVAAGDLTCEEAAGRMEANIAAMLALIPCIQGFDVNNLGGGGNNAGAGGGAGGGNNAGGGQQLPQTGAAATTTALAGATVVGIGAIAAIVKNKKK